MRKKLITMGLVSALGASTSAWAIDLDDPADTPDAFATDTIVAADLDADGNTIIVSSVIETTALGVGVASGNQIFVRIDLGNAAFTGAGVVAGDITVGAATAVAVAQGGAADSSFVIFDITAPAAELAQADTVDFTPASGIALSGTSSGTVTMTVYETLTQAVNQTDNLYTIAGTFATTGVGIATTATSATAVADVTTDFTMFTGAATTAALGTIFYDITGLLEPGGAASAIGDSIVQATSTITGSGDMTFGDWYLEGGGCTGAPGDIDLVEDTTTNDSASATDVTTLATAGGVHTLCVDVDGTEIINESGYTLDFGWDTIATAVYPLADTSDSVGAIVRNGTTVQVPYLTTFEDYNQRVVLVNRGSADANYSFSFTTESDTTATAGSAATGTIPAMTVLSLRASDIVTLTGKTRTAATINIVATPANIDAATNQVNLADGSTDTVVLQ